MSLAALLSGEITEAEYVRRFKRAIAEDRPFGHSRPDSVAILARHGYTWSPQGPNAAVTIRAIEEVAA